VITENRNGLVVAAMATEAGNAAERQAALKMIKGRKTSEWLSVVAPKSTLIR
jgi:hypothetical protein